MATKPDITLSSLDVDRIYDLIESLPDNSISTEQLEKELERATIVEPEQLPPHVVTMNSKVKFLIDTTKKDFFLTLVYPKDLDNTGTKVSILAPIGSALIGLSKGDSIKWTKPDGSKVDVTILEVTYQPERVGEYRL